MEKVQKEVKTARPLTISRNSWFLRFFIWVWEADPEKLNLCKLFWGTLFFPLALLRVRLIYRFIPGPTIWWIGGAAILALFDLWFSAALWLSTGFIYAIGGYIYYSRKKRSVTERREEKLLSKITEKGSKFAERMAESRTVEWLGAIVEWILVNTLGRLFDFIDNISGSKVGQRIRGFFAIIAEYFRAVKKRYCPIVQVV